MFMLSQTCHIYLTHIYIYKHKCSRNLMSIHEIILDYKDTNKEFK